MTAVARERLAALAAALALAAFALREALFDARALFERDLETLFYGRAEVLRRCFAEGTLPLWNPYPAFGEPLLALGVTQVLYPPAWLALLLPAPVAVALSAALHLGFTGLGLFVLARRLGLSRAAAALAAVSWSSGDTLLSLVNMPNLLTGSAWLPWAALAALSLRAPRGRNRVAGAGKLGARPAGATSPTNAPPPPHPLWLAGALAAPLLAGSPEAFLMCAAAALAAVTWSADDADPGAARARFARLALAVTLGLGLAAAQWLPTLVLGQRSARAALGERAQAYWSQHPAGLAQWALPVSIDDLPLAARWRQDLFENREPLLASIYVGVLGLPLALAGLALAPRRPRAALGALLVVATAAALGRHLPGFEWWSGLPGLSGLRYPSKAMVLAGFTLALLSGFGLDALRASLARRSRAFVAALCALLGLVALWASAPGAAAWSALLVTPATLGHAWLQSPAYAATLQALTFAGAVALAGAGLLLRVDTRAATVAVAALASLDAVVAIAGLNPTASATAFAWRTPALGALPRERPNRVYGIDYPDAAAQRLLGRSPYRSVPLDTPPDALLLLGRLYPVSELGAGALGIEGFPADVPQLRSAAVTRWLRTLEGVLDTPAFPRLLQLSGAEHLLSLHVPGPGFTPVGEARGVHETVKLSRVDGALPRAYVVAGVRPLEGQAAFDALVAADFDPRGEVVLAPGAALPATPAGSAGRVDALQLGLDRVALDVTLERPGLVVLLEAWDPGWRATVDGVAVDVVAANLVFRAVRVEAGHHRVEMVYRPVEVVAGAAVSGLALLAAAVLARRGIKKMAGADHADAPAPSLARTLQ